MADKIMVHPGDSFIVEKDDECIQIMNDLRETMFERDMVLSILQTSTTISQDVYNTVKNDYRAAFTKHQDVKNKCSNMVLSRYDSEDGAILQWNYDQLKNEIYVSLQ